jgi:hypothetical protein
MLLAKLRKISMMQYLLARCWILDISSLSSLRLPGEYNPLKYDDLITTKKETRIAPWKGHDEGILWSGTDRGRLGDHLSCKLHLSPHIFEEPVTDPYYSLCGILSIRDSRPEIVLFPHI